MKNSGNDSDFDIYAYFLTNETEWDTWMNSTKTVKEPLSGEEIFVLSFNFLLCLAFIWYGGRISFRRVANFSAELQQPNFVMLVVLSFVGVFGAVAHCLYLRDYYNSISPSSIIENDPMILTDVFKVSTNRLVAPFVIFYLIHQCSIHSNSIPTALVSWYSQLIFCVASILVICGSTIYAGSLKKEKLNNQIRFKPDPYPSILDIAPQMLAVIIFFVAKYRVCRRTVYFDKDDLNSPTPIDLISKVISWYLIMLSATLFSFVFYESSSFDDLSAFILCQQSPMVHFCLLRSLLRSRKSTRLCCLIRCSLNEDQIDVEDNTTPTQQYSLQNRHNSRGNRQSTQNTVDGDNNAQSS